MVFHSINSKLLWLDVTGSGPHSVVFIHGLGSSTNYYQPQAEYLSSLPGYTCIRFDTQGAGRSLLRESKISLEDIAQDFIAILDYLKVEKASVVAHSLGGMVASYVASKYPSRVVKLVLIGPVHPTDKLAEAMSKRAEAVENAGMQAVCDVIPKAATSPNSSPLTRAFIREVLLSQTANVEGYIAHCKLIASATAPSYADIKAETLIVVGEHDKTAPLNECEIILKGIESGGGKGKIEILENVGHWICVEAPEKVARSIEAFLT